MKMLCCGLLIFISLNFSNCCINDSQSPDDSAQSPDDSAQSDDRILFYCIDNDSNVKFIYTMDIDGNNLTLHAKGNCCYPFWYDDKQNIIYIDHDFPSLLIKEYDSHLNESSTFLEYNDNVMFTRHSKILNGILYSYNYTGRSKIGIINLVDETFTDLTTTPYDERNPVCSNVDEWIYFTTKINETFDIYRINYERTNYELVLADEEYDFGTFSISSDGNLIVVSKYNNTDSFIVVYDLNSNEIIYEIEHMGEGNALYPSLTIENEYILFVDGIPYDYSSPRNIYRMNLDGTNLIQLTNFKSMLSIRPLAW